MRKKKQQTCSSEQLEQIVVLLVYWLFDWLVASARWGVSYLALHYNCWNLLKCKNISTNPRQNRSVTWLQNESSSKLFIEALSTDRNHKSPSHTRICRSHCWYKFRFRLEGNFSSEWFLLRWPSVSLLSYFFNACSQLYVLPVCACCCSSVCSMLPVRHVTCALYELTTAARQLARTLLWLWTSNGLTEWNNIFIRPSEIVERDTCGASWWLLRLYFWITAQTNEPKAKQGFSFWFVTF